MAEAPKPVVHIVDDEPSVRQSTAELLRVLGREVVEHASGDLFLSAADIEGVGCVVLDLDMPGTHGLVVLERLNERRSSLGVIIVSGIVDVPIAVKAMRMAAVDVLQKPYDPAQLMAAVDLAVEASLRVSAGGPEPDARQRLAQLSPREAEVLRALVNGATNSDIAKAMKLSPRTVEMHRANMMKRLGTRTLSETLRVAYDAGLRPPDRGSRRGRTLTA